MRADARAARRAILGLFLALGAAGPLRGAATVTIVPMDPAGSGFRDVTPVAPVGGNAGTTLGEQRLIAFRRAAEIWGALLDSSVEIRVQGSFTRLTCDAISGVLAAASPIQAVQNFPGAALFGTWYPVPLANRRAGRDLLPGEPGSDADDIRVRFNSGLGASDCVPGSGWYYGLDNAPGNGIDFVSVALHELAHGLGFLTFVNPGSGAEFLGSPDIFERFILDTSSGLRWTAMTEEERADSARRARRIVWDGPRVAAAVPAILDLGSPVLRIHSPATVAGEVPVGLAAFGPPVDAAGVAGRIVAAADAGDAEGPSPTDGCSPLTNAAEIAGRIALVDRGSCFFVVKARNAEAAGARALIVVDNEPGSPPPALGGEDPTIGIPSVAVSRADGGALRTAAPQGVEASLGLDTTRRAGADAAGRALLLATDPVQPGSSISHWDSIASPTLLMQTGRTDRTHGVDLTLPLLLDIGWSADLDFDGVPDGTDNCPFSANPGQEDLNGNGTGDACDRLIRTVPPRGATRGIPPRS